MLVDEILHQFRYPALREVQHMGILSGVRFSPSSIGLRFRPSGLQGFVYFTSPQLTVARYGMN